MECLRLDAGSSAGCQERYFWTPYLMELMERDRTRGWSFGNMDLSLWPESTDPDGDDDDYNIITAVIMRTRYGYFNIRFI